MIKMLSGNLKKVFLPDFSCTHGRMCVYGRYAPAIVVIIKPSTVQSKKVHAALTVVVKLHQLFESSQLTIMAELHARGQSPIAKKIWLSIHVRKFGSHVIVRPTVRPHHRATNVEFHTFQLVWEPAAWYCTFMLSPIDSCQDRVSADQYHITVSQAQVSTHFVSVFF